MKPLMALLLMLFTWSSQAQAADPLRGYGADLGETTVSGLSSGGYMATQIHLAYSSLIDGVGNVAGGPYYCAASEPGENNVVTAVFRCMDPCEAWPGFMRWFCKITWQPLVLVEGEAMVEHAAAVAEQGLIDSIGHLRDDRVYLFSGGRDTTVVPAVVDQTRAFYAGLGVAQGALRLDRIEDAGHAFITPGSDRDCDAINAPFVNRCGDYHQAWEILSHLYGSATALNPPAATLSGTMVEFDQAAFVQPGERLQASGLADTAFAYVPAECQSRSCRVHIAFHGCRQSSAEYATNDLYFRNITGYNPIADSNRMIVVYPQIRARATMQEGDTPYNPRGCWDFWGYSGEDFYTRDAVQMKAVRGMIERLGEARH